MEPTVEDAPNAEAATPIPHIVDTIVGEAKFLHDFDLAIIREKLGDNYVKSYLEGLKTACLREIIQIPAARLSDREVVVLYLMHQSKLEVLGSLLQLAEVKQLPNE